jgi:hypothetical protein
MRFLRNIFGYNSVSIDINIMRWAKTEYKKDYLFAYYEITNGRIPFTGVM